MGLGAKFQEKKTRFRTIVRDGSDAVGSSAGPVGFLAEVASLALMFLNMFFGLFLVIWPFRRRRQQRSALAKKKSGTTAWLSSQTTWVRLSSDFRYTDMSPSFCELLGFSRSELIGHSAEDITPADFVNFDKLRDEIRREGKKTGYWVYRRRDGFFVLVRYAVTVRADGMADLVIEKLPVAS